MALHFNHLLQKFRNSNNSLISPFATTVLVKKGKVSENSTLPNPWTLIPSKKIQPSRNSERLDAHRKAVTEGKSEVVVMTHRETAAKANWQRRRARAPVVPAIPCTSFILTRGGAASVVGGGASTGCTAGPLILLASSMFSHRFNTLKEQKYKSRRRNWAGKRRRCDNQSLSCTGIRKNVAVEAPKCRVMTTVGEGGAEC